MSGENSVVDADKSPSENNEDMGHVGGKNSYNGKLCSMWQVWTHNYILICVIL